MTHRGRLEKQYEGDSHPLEALLATLAGESRVLCQTSTSAVERAAAARRAAADVRARSRALRGVVVRVRLPRDSSCAGRARRFLEQHLDGYPSDFVSDTKTVASELVSNAYRHGEGAIEAELSIGADRIDRSARPDE